MSVRSQAVPDRLSEKKLNSSQNNFRTQILLGL